MRSIVFGQNIIEGVGAVAFRTVDLIRGRYGGLCCDEYIARQVFHRNLYHLIRIPNIIIVNRHNGYSGDLEMVPGDRHLTG